MEGFNAACSPHPRLGWPGVTGGVRPVVFGPVWSRRLGWSLGVNLVPAKTCTWNCVYCYLGCAYPTVARRRWVDERLVVEKVLEAVERVRVDYATLIGIGEPTLASNIGRVVELLKSEAGVRVAVFSNGSLYYRGVAWEVGGADYVKATLTTLDEEKWRLLHRPVEPPSLEKHIEGLYAASDAARSFHVEVMLVRGVNDSTYEAYSIGLLLRDIRVESIVVNVPSRPGCATWASPPSHDRILEYASVLAHVSGKHVEVLAARPVKPPRLDQRRPLESLVEVVSTHILSLREALEALREAGVENPDDTLKRLVKEGRVEVKRVGGEEYLYAHRPG